jgi:4-hydroxybenzoate polyprenyltransferase
MKTPAVNNLTNDVTHTPTSVTPMIRPLVVDLDGSLIYSDLLWESLLQFLKHKPWAFFQVILWLLQGKAVLKHQLAQYTEIHVESLPYDDHLLREIKQRKAQLTPIVLATGSHRKFAEKIANHLQVFDLVLATDANINLTSKNKAAKCVELYGAGGFDYIGNSSHDIPVWQQSHQAYSVTKQPFNLGAGRYTSHLGGPRVYWLKALLRALRPRQWLKNTLVFVPVLASHQLQIDYLVQAAWAFLLFSMCASSAYLLNDALDLSDDRRHHEKHKRPLASGALSLPLALVFSAILAVSALVCAANLSWPVFAVVTLYFISTLTYSLYLKRLLMIDVIMLAFLYTLRIIGGGVSTQIELSFWLLSFSFFIFLSLALLKRHSELFNLDQAGKKKANGRGYTTADRMPVGMMGVNCGFLAILILMLYFNSSNVAQLYRQPEYLLGIIPLIVFWLGRMWVLSFRGEVNEDPIVFVSRDRIGLLVLFLALSLAYCATLNF